MPAHRRGLLCLLVPCAALALGGTAACEKTLRGNELMASLPLDAHELAGITISLPQGELTKKTVTYRSGEVHVLRKQGRRLVVSLAWQVGEPLTGDELVMLTDAIARDMKRGEQWQTKIGAYAVHGAYYDGPKLSAVFGSFACGKRSLFISIMGKGQAGELRALHDRIAISARCVDDDAAAERLLAPVFAAPSGFGYSAADSSPETIVFNGLDGSGYAFFHSGAAGMLDNPKLVGDTYEKLLATMVPGLELADDVERLEGLDGGRRLLWKLTIPESDTPAASGLLVAWMCESVGTNFMGMYVSEHAETLDAGRQALLSARCPDKDDDPVAGYVTAEAVFEAACVVGDQRGCVDE